MQGSHLIQRLTIAATAQVGVLILGLSFQVLLAKMMQPHEYATYAVALAGAALFASLASLGISRAIARFLPIIMLKGGKKALRNAIARYISYRTGGVLFVISAAALTLWFFQSNWILDQVYDHRIILLWFVLLLLQMDAEAVAQSLMEQGIWSIATLMEVVTRTSLTAVAGWSGHLDAITAISIWSFTSMVLIVGVMCIIFLRRHRYQSDHTISADSVLDVQLHPATQLSFALGIYISSFGWLATSPAAIRLVSAPSTGCSFLYPGSAILSPTGAPTPAFGNRVRTCPHK